VKLMLYYPFKYIDKLLLVDRVVYSSYKEAFAAYYEYHSHDKNYYINLEPDEDVLLNNNNNLDNIEIGSDPKVDVPLTDFEAYV
jgi:hypothetical protein